MDKSILDILHKLQDISLGLSRKLTEDEVNKLYYYIEGLEKDIHYLSTSVDRVKDQAEFETAKAIIDYVEFNSSHGYDYPDEPHSPLYSYDPYLLEELRGKYGVI